MPPGLPVLRPHSDAAQVLPLKISFACPCWGTALRPGYLLTALVQAAKALQDSFTLCVFLCQQENYKRLVFLECMCCVPNTQNSHEPWALPSNSPSHFHHPIFPSLCFLPSHPALDHVIQSCIFQSFMCADWQACTYILAS